MKKNTKYKNNSKSIGIDILVIIISLAIITYFMFLFFQNLNMTLTRTDKKQIATISFKYKSVQRKFLDSAIWDRPVQFSPVYDGDIIRTSPGAEATITFENENKIMLGSSTMIQVFAEDPEKKATLNLSEGAVSVQTSKGSEMLVNSNKTSVTVEAGSALRADKSKEKKLKLIVERGQASVVQSKSSDSSSQAQEKEVLTEGQVNEFVDTGNDKVETDESILLSKSITMISPADNLKVLNQKKKGEPADIFFQWYSSFDKNEELILETSASKKFSKIRDKYVLNSLENLTIQYAKGPLYWRAYIKSKGYKDESAISGKVMVLAAYPPKLLSPSDNEEYSFKEAYPPVNFTWEGNDIATSYLLEVADNPEMKEPKLTQVSNVTSLTFDNLTEGVWFWRVTPQYFLGVDTNFEASPIYSFKIEKKEKLKAPEFISPESFGKASNNKVLNFSWKPVVEASKYKISISKNKDMSNPIITDFSNTNNFKLPPDIKSLKEGDYYISVSAIGASDTLLTKTPSQKFTVKPEELILRSVFPPDSYTIADTLCFDTRFTWKSNLNTESIFQVSSSKDFQDIVIEKQTNKQVLDGVKLNVGTWYWRILSRVGNKEIKTEVKKLIIAPPLEKPKLIDVKKRVLVVEDKINKFKWTKVKGADYYQVKISLPDRNSAPLYENLFITENEISIDLNDIDDGTFIISVQGFASPTVMSGRRYSLALDHYTVFKHLKPAELVYPKNKDELSGLICGLKESEFKCKYSEPPTKAVVFLERRLSGRWKRVAKINNLNSSITVPKLSPGKYRWYIRASVENNLDISSKTKNYFEVLPIKPLARAKVISPVNNKVFNVSYFKNNNSIIFKWRKVKTATHYIFVLRKKGGEELVRKEILNKSFKGNYIVYRFKELANLSRGEFEIKIKAQRRNEKGAIFQDGRLKTSRFTVDLPKSKKLKTKKAGVLYGK